MDEGRATLNFTEWDRPQAEVDEVFDIIAEGEMPPWNYTLTHRDARLSEAERRELIAGLRETLRLSPPIQGEGEPEDE